ncbi:cobyrinate a,c-diamide synthase [Massilistercora timonensis]|uniref:cobyrinate a,c-diamide synthase n=1 Tax=Massilistercora timonensis TaxID=2086584 RepID=UPI003AB47D39
MGRIPRLLIGAARSGAGKTLITCALLKALQKRKKQAVSFKCGPDYIDPLFHREALGIDSDNLDSFFCTPDQVRALLRERAGNCEIAVLEGVMGYYDGLGGMKEEASTYDIARITGTPAVLVVDARGASLSLLPLIRGFREFREESQIRGVIFNRMSPGMYPQMKKLVEEEMDLRVFGYLPVLPEGILESRHLGLKLPWEAPGWKERLEALGERLEETVDVEGLLELAETAEDLGESATGREEGAPVRIAVARDEAFCFCYRDNLDFLEKRGGELVFFSPLHDAHFPEGVKGLGLYGGYPELWGSQLEANETLRRELGEAVRGGLPCVAECGGFQYLQERLRTAEGSYAMAGVLEGESFPAGSQRFGYVELTGGRLFGEPLTVPLRAHEFHYYDSSRCGEGFTARKPVSGRQWPCMISEKTLLAGYPHFHYRGNPQIGEAFLEACRRYAKEKG